MRHLPIALAGLIIPLIAASSSPAQMPPPGLMWPTMMQNKKIQAEIRMTEDQVEKTEEWMAEAREKMKALQQELQNLPAAGRREKLATVTKLAQEERAQFLSETLRPEQAARLRQIEIQGRGLKAFELPDVVEQLRLSAEQKEKIKALKAELVATSEAIHEAFPGDIESARTKFFEAQDSIQGRALDCLTVEQKATWKAMIGEAFDVRSLAADRPSR